MNEAANDLAEELLEFGICPDAPVGIMMERSLEMVLAVLGVLKAGGTYVPLDHTYPADRLSFILEDTQAKVLLTQQKFSEGFLCLQSPSLSYTLSFAYASAKKLCQEEQYNCSVSQILIHYML